MNDQIVSNYEKKETMKNSTVLLNSFLFQLEMNKETMDMQTGNVPKS